MLLARGRWDQVTGDLAGFDERLGAWIDAFESDVMPDSAAYQLRQIVDDLAEDPDFLLADLRRWLSRRDSGSESPRQPTRSDALKLLQKRIYAALGLDHPAMPVAIYPRADRLAGEWLLARWLAAHRYSVSTVEQVEIRE